MSPYQSGFRPGDSTINQLISITTEIYEAFENHDEIRAVFLDISKAFDKVWHEGLLHKLKENGITGSVYHLLEDYLSNRKQRVVLNGIESEWEDVLSGVPQGSVLGPLLFLIYINDLTDGIFSRIRLFADDSSLFARVTDINATHDQLLKDLDLITNWAHQWKMKFNPDISKQAIEVIFSHKHNKPNHPLLSFNNIPVARENHTKHLGLVLDDRLSFRKHIHDAIQKANTGLALMKYLSSFVSRHILNMTYKLYVRPHLDYGDIIFHDQLSDMMKSIESVQYKAALIVTGSWPGTNRLRLYEEVGWESLSDRIIYRRFALFFKILKNDAPSYLFDHIHELPNEANMTRRYKNSFYVFCQRNWVSLDERIKKLANVDLFKRNYLRITGIRPLGNSVYKINDKYGLSLLTRIRLKFSDLREHRFNHHFNCQSAMCKCALENETSEKFLLRCPRFSAQRRVMLDSVFELCKINVENLVNDSTTKLFLYGDERYNSITNKLILEITITGRFKNIEA